MIGGGGGGADAIVLYSTVMGLVLPSRDHATIRRIRMTEENSPPISSSALITVKRAIVVSSSQHYRIENNEEVLLCVSVYFDRGFLLFSR
jgi:hypothetical protein